MPALVAAAAAQAARTEAAQGEALAVTKQARALSLELDAAEERCRRLEAQHQFQSTGSPVEELRRREAEQLQKAMERERELRQQLQDQLRSQQAEHSEELKRHSEQLAEAQGRTERLEAEEQRAAAAAATAAAAAVQKPAAAELRWQREVQRLRDELAEGRQLWRQADPRLLMRRDKELRRLGLDPRSMDESVRKGQVAVVLAETCRALGVAEPSHIPLALGKLLEAAAAAATADAKHRSFAHESLRLLEEMEAETGAPGGAPPSPTKPEDLGGQVLAKLRRVGAEVRRLRAQELREAKLQQDAVLEERWHALSSELRVPSGAAPGDCVHKVTELRVGEAILDGLVAQLRCAEPQELPRKVAALLRHCDEAVAAQRIVAALCELLRVESIEEVLPALKDVLDVSALRARRHRASPCTSVTESPATTVEA